MATKDDPGDRGSEASSRTEELLDRVERGLEEGSLPLEIFNNDDVFRLELERVFARSWVFVGHESEIAENGEYALRYVGDDPFILVRDEEGEIRLFFNSCRHRGTKVCKTEAGNTSHFRCPYHGWTYKNTGELVGVAQQNKAYPNIDKEEFSLHEAPRVDTYGGMVFASLDPDAPDLEEFLGAGTWYLDPHFETVEWEVLGEPQRWELDVDWKMISDNTALDNYHVPIGHQSAIDQGVGVAEGLDANVGGDDTTLLGFNAGRVSGTVYRVNPDLPVYWGHPEEVVDLLDLDVLSDEQIDRYAKRTANFTANVFPNLSISHMGSTNDEDKPFVGVMMFRQWQPRGPGEIEAWAWILAPKEAPEAYKNRVREAATGAFGISGNFFVDDVAILEGIAEAGGSTFAKQRDLSIDYTMGMDEENEAEVIADWPGPGTCYRNGVFTSDNNLNFYRNWYDFLSS